MSAPKDIPQDTYDKLTEARAENERLREELETARRENSGLKGETERFAACREVNARLRNQLATLKDALPGLMENQFHAGWAAGFSPNEIGDDEATQAYAELQGLLQGLGVTQGAVKNCGSCRHRFEPSYEEICESCDDEGPFAHFRRFLDGEFTHECGIIAAINMVPNQKGE